MPLMPKRVKHRKEQRGKLKGNATRGNFVAFGDYGLQALDKGWISARQIEAGRITASHYLGGEGKLHIRLFPHKPITSKPLEVRMGKGKGEPDYWACPIRPGAVMFEIEGVPQVAAKELFRRIAMKMPVRCRFVKRRTH
ncbi:MAG: 50S ribosomal protein L16 [Planctomycetota bacterium]|jgi:large subunit ribosomal protein L16